MVFGITEIGRRRIKPLELLVLLSILMFPAESFAAECTLNTLGTDITGSPDLALENIEIRQESPLSATRVLVEVAARIRNLDAHSHWAFLKTSLAPEYRSLYDIDNFQGGIVFERGTILPGQIVTNTGAPISVLVNASDVSTAIRC